MIDTTDIDVLDFDLFEDDAAPSWSNRRRAISQERTSWIGLSNCLQLKDERPDMYPPRATTQDTVAKDFCGTCPTQKQCLFIALVNNDEDGVWGGTTEAVRSLVLKQVREWIPDFWDEWSPDKEALLEDVAHTIVERNYERHEVDPRYVEALGKQRMSHDS